MLKPAPLLFLASFFIGCNGVDTAHEAELAYLGLDGATDRALNLGMDGYNAASSANIDAQEGPGDVSGTLTVSGKVDQGSSDNKGLRLEMQLTECSDTLGDVVTHVGSRRVADLAVLGML